MLPRVRLALCHGVFCLVLAFVLESPSVVGASSARPDRPSALVLDLTRGNGKPLSLHLELPAGVWAYPDDRSLGRVEPHAAQRVALKYLRDAGATGWAAQAYLSVLDPGRAPADQVPTSKRDAPVSVRRYFETLAQAYEDAGYEVHARPGAPKAGKSRRVGSKRVTTWFGDLVVSWTTPGEARARPTHVNVFVLPVRDWLVVLRIHLGAGDRTSVFTDGLGFSIRSKLPRAVREVKATAVTSARQESRVAFQLPKAFRRDARVLDAEGERGTVGRWIREPDRGERTGRIVLLRETSRLDPDRDLEMFRRQQGDLMANELAPGRAGSLGDTALHVATSVGERVEGVPHVVCLATWRVDEHPYSLRFEVPATARRALRQQLREWGAMLESLRVWLTRPHTR